MPDDTELLRKYAAENSESAFTELVRRYLDLVYSAALRQVGGDVHRAKDVCQLVFTRLARKAPQLTAHPVLAGWLYLTTHHIAAHAIRSELRRRVREQKLWAMHEVLSSHADEPETNWAQLRPVLDESMRELKESDREALLLRFFMQRPYAEIGAALGLNEDAIRRRVDRALDKLREQLSRRGITSTAAALNLALANQVCVAAPAGLATSVSSAALTSVTLGTPAMALVTLFAMKKINVVVSVVAVIVLGVAGWEVAANYQASKMLAALETETHRARAALLLEQRRVKEMRTETVALQREIDAANLAEATIDAQATPAEIRVLFARSRKAAIAEQYYPFYRELGLSGAQIARFEELMVDGMKTRHPGIAEIVVGEGLSKAEKDRQLRELLGSEGLQRLKQEQTSFLSYYVQRLASSLALVEPLSSEQGRAMKDIFREAGRSGAKNVEQLWEPILERSANVLSERQRSALLALKLRDEFAWAKDQHAQAARSRAPEGQP